MPDHHHSGHHHHGDDDRPATKQDLRELEHKIMSTQKDLTEAAVSLSETANNLTTQVDILVEKIDAVVEVLQNVSLPPEAEEALAGLKASKDKTTTASSHVAAELGKLDNIGKPSTATSKKTKASSSE